MNITVPAFPVVVGCNPNQYCTIDTSARSGNFTCKVEGIRPKVQLEWKEIVSGSSSQQITFRGHDTTTDRRGDLFDVYLTSQYEIKSPKVESRITIECRIAGSNSDLFDAPARFDLQYSLRESSVTFLE